MRVTFEGTIHEILDQIEDFCSGLIKTTTPAPKKVAKPKIEQPEPTPCQAHAVEQEKVEISLVSAPEDLLGAVMALVNGDKEKKAKLVTILAAHDAKTIGALKADKRDAFWTQAQYELGGE